MSGSPAISDSSAPKTRRGLLAVIGPGILVAATGVGAGDLATAGFAGAELGLAVGWAVLAGAAIKLALTENLARHQLATGRTILESSLANLGLWIALPFGLYLICWSFFVGGALLSASATAVAAIVDGAFTVETAANTPARLAYAAAASAAGALLARAGGFKLFERLMAACVAAMVLVVLAAAVLTKPDPAELFTGLVIPTIPSAGDGGLGWTVALMGGVGGTLTIICYGHWMRQSGRDDPAALAATRLDITVGYGVTALFGVAMLVIAAPLAPQGEGAGLIVDLADQLGAGFRAPYGDGVAAAMRWAFLIGALGTFFSSLLGVWQAVPMIFSEWLTGTRRLLKPDRTRAATGADSQIDHARSRPARLFLLALAIVPLATIPLDFSQIQKLYALVGAAFVPGLAVVLLILNNHPALVPASLRNRWLSNTLLALSLVLAAALAVLDRLL